MTQKSRSDYRLNFTNKALTILEDQTIAFDFGTESVIDSTFVHQTNKSVIWIEEDTDGIVHKTIRCFVEQSMKSDLVVDVILNNVPVEKFVLYDVVFSAVQHSIFNNQNQIQHLNLKLQSANSSSFINGTMTPSSENTSCVKLVQISFRRYEHKFINVVH